MNIIITGADGFVGTHLVNHLKTTKHNLLLIGGDESKMIKIFGEEIKSFSYVGINQLELRNACDEFNPDIVVHLAAYNSVHDDFSEMEKLIDANLLFLAKLLVALKNTNLKCFINTGSSTEFYQGDDVLNPAYLYSATKSASRPVIQYFANTYKYKYFTICPYNIYGAVDTRKKIMDLFYDSLGSAIPIDTTKGEQILDFIHIADIINLYMKCIENIDIIPHESCFQGGTGKGHSLRELVAILEKQSGRKANINWGGINYRNRDIMYSVANISLQKTIMNWESSISLDEGIKKYLDSKDKTTASN